MVLRRWLLSLALSVAAGCAVTSASADAGNESLALTTFEEGRRLFEAHDYDGALRAFQASLDAMPSPNSRLYVARCLREQGKSASAFATFRMASREAEDRVRATGDKRYAATQKSAALEAERLEPLVPHVMVNVVSADGHAGDLEHAAFELDGAPLTRAQLATPIALDPGPHAFSVSGSHVQRSEIKVSVVARDAKTVTLSVQRAPFGTVRLVLKTRPGGLAAELDGEPVELSSAGQTRDVSVGPHRLSARAPGYASLLWEGSVADQATVDVVIELAPAPPAPVAAAADSAPSGTPKWLFFATAGVAIAGLGAGAFLVADASARDDQERAKPESERDAAARDDIKTRAGVGSALLIGGGAVAVVASVLGLTTRWRKRPASTAARAGFEWNTPGRVSFGGEF